MAKTLVNNSTPTHDEISARAHQIYIQNGSQPGRDVDNWLQAEAELRAQSTALNGNGKQSPDMTPTIPNSVLPAATPIAQVTRTTTPRRSGKREVLAAK